MINETQIWKVRNYLLSKNLPIDLLIEVEDHFITQILQNEDTDFENAFYKVKVLWEKELSFPKFNIQFDLNDTTFFVRKINRRLMKETMKNSLKFSICILAFMLAFAQLLNELSYGYFSLILLITVYISPLLIYFRNMKDFLFARQYGNYMLTYYQNHILVVAGGAGAFCQLLFNYRNGVSASIFKMMSGSFTWGAFWAIAGCFGLIIWSVFNVISQKKYLQQINTVKPFLKYLRASSYRESVVVNSFHQIREVLNVPMRFEGCTFSFVLVCDVR